MTDESEADAPAPDEPAQPAPEPAVAPPATSAPVSIARYSQLYAVSRNPFGLAAVLPMVLFAFIGLEAALLAVGQLDTNNTKIIITGFLFFTGGLLLVPAVVLRGSITFDDAGIAMNYGKQSLSASWDKVAGLVYDVNAGVCVLIKGQTQNRPKLKVPGGLHAVEGGEALIPIRFFGDRRFAILYEVRDRVPETAWKHALQEGQPGGARRPLIIYALTVIFGSGCMVAVALAVSK